jgi:transcriptional regulator with XRE-family HTH domain
MGEDERSGEAESARLREGLKALLKRYGRSVREIERDQGLGHGTLGAVLRGRSNLCVRHLAIVAQALGLAVPELLTEVYGLAGRPDAAQPAPHSRLRALVAEVVRAELAAFWERHGIGLDA